jgi:hypothetical protein
MYSSSRGKRSFEAPRISSKTGDEPETEPEPGAPWRAARWMRRMQLAVAAYADLNLGLAVCAGDGGLESLWPTVRSPP